MTQSFASFRCILCVAVAALAWPAWAPQDAKPAVPTTHAFHVLFEMGKKYDPKVDIKTQPGFAEHFKYVHQLASEGTLLVGGPLFESLETEKFAGAVMVVRAKDEKAVRELLATDAFVAGEMIQIASIRPFLIGAGAWIPKETPKSGTAR